MADEPLSDFALGMLGKIKLMDELGTPIRRHKVAEGAFAALIDRKLVYTKSSPAPRIPKGAASLTCHVTDAGMAQLKEGK